MMKYVMPVVLIGIAITVFFLFTDSLYNDIGTLGTEISSYNDALNNATTLENERDKLTTKYNAINPDDITKLQKLLPENVDNIRLILEIEQIASPYNMVLTDVKYNATENKTTAATPTPTAQGGAVAKPTANNYGTFDLAFSVTGSYNNFIAFLKDLESNLRIVDISSIDFSSDNTNNTGGAAKTASSEVYKYNFAFKTYWLQN